MIRYLSIAVFLVVASVVAEQQAAAQAGPVPRYYPNRSTISPYMNFFIGPDPGVLDRYNAYVRPAQGLQRSNNAQNDKIQKLQNEVQFLRKSGLSPTGKGGSFNNTGGYYPGGGRR